MPGLAPVTGKYVAGAITSLGPSSITVQVTSTGPHDTDLMGQTLTIAITPETVIVVNGQTASSSELRSGDAVALRVVKSPTGYTANSITATTS